MSEKVAIVIDTASDIQEFPEIEKISGAKKVPVYVIFDETSYATSDISMEDYHARLQNIKKKSEWPTTSAPAPQDFDDVYSKLKEEGYTNIISLHVAEKLSGTLNAAFSAKVKFEEMNIELIDTQSASVGELAALLKTHSLLKEGMAFEEVVDQIRRLSDETTIYVTIDTLDYLRMGGRISHVKYRIGKWLRMKPILTVHQGVINSFDKTRDIKKSREKVFEYATKDYHHDDHFTFIIGHTRSPDVAQKMSSRFKSEFPNSNGYIGEIGTAIATHVGPGAIGVITFQ
ncbi:MAG: DegV family protein [Candidatus Kariarchaeaceae archaeon]